MSVNAIACAPKRVALPERDTGGWREPLGTSSRAPSAAESIPANATEWWRASLGRAAAGPPSFGTTVIAAMDLDRYLSVIDRATGDRLWHKRLASPGVAGPLVAEERVYVGTGGPTGRLYAFTVSGKKVWDRQIRGIVGAIALAGGNVLAATERGGVVACDAVTGEVRWSRRVGPAVRAGVVSAKNDVLVATDDSLFRLEADHGRTVAAAQLPGTVISPAARQGDTLVVATADGQILAFSRDSLRVLWSLDVSAPLFGGPAIARDSVFAVSIRGDLWGIPLDHAGGARAVPIGTAVRNTPAPVREGVLIGTLGGEIVLVRGDSVIRYGRVEGPVEQPVIVSGGTVFVLDGRGRLHAWR